MGALTVVSLPSFSDTNVTEMLHAGHTYFHVHVLAPAATCRFPASIMQLAAKCLRFSSFIFITAVAMRCAWAGVECCCLAPLLLLPLLLAPALSCTAAACCLEAATRASRY